MSGSDNVLANLFKYLGLLGAIGGGVMVVLASTGLPIWNTGEAVHADFLLAGALFAVMGIGFITFGMMIKVEKWEQAVN